MFILTTSCSTIVTISPEGKLEAHSWEEITLYADNVFRRQSDANKRIIMYLIDYESGEGESFYEELLEAEEKIAAACKLMNRIAVARAEQRNVNILQTYQMLNSVGKCEHATRKIEGLMQEL